MSLRTAEQYLAALREGRTVCYRGRRVAGVTADPELRVAVDHAALDYALRTTPRTGTLRSRENRTPARSTGSSGPSPMPSRECGCCT
jgi:aromatic ring hydroxylase